MLNDSEWPESVFPYIDSKTIALAKRIRQETDCVMIPSPDPEAHVRRDARSRSLHSINNKNRKSLATDIFLKNDQAPTFWSKAQLDPYLGGFGMYFDTKLSGKKRVMVHLDLRPERMLWVCPDVKPRKYIYFHKNPEKYLSILGEEFKKLNEG